MNQNQIEFFLNSQRRVWSQSFCLKQIFSFQNPTLPLPVANPDSPCLQKMWSRTSFQICHHQISEFVRCQSLPQTGFHVHQAWRQQDCQIAHLRPHLRHGHYHGSHLCPLCCKMCRIWNHERRHCQIC